MLTIENVIAAKAIVDRHLLRSPLERSPYLSAELGAEIHLKLENLRPTRSFKVRGALTKVASLGPEARARGVVTASGGNHAQGVAYAAHVLGVRATVVMPETVSEAIVGSCRAYGAEVLQRGRIYNDAVSLAEEVASTRGATYVHAYGDPHVIAGQGTIGLEIVEDLPNVGTIVVPIGGGGLICGIALAAKERTQGRVRIVGVEPEGADKMRRSLAAGRVVVMDAPHSVAERLVTKSPEPLNVEIAGRYVDEVVTVSDDALLAASAELLTRLSLLVEPSGAAPLAALRSGALRASGPTVLIASGGNMDASLLARVLAVAT